MKPEAEIDTISSLGSYKPGNSQGMPEATRSWSDKEGFVPRAFRGTVALLTIDYRLLASRLRVHISVVLTCPVCGTLLQSPRKQIPKLLKKSKIGNVDKEVPSAIL